MVADFALLSYLVAGSQLAVEVISVDLVGVAFLKALPSLVVLEGQVREEDLVRGIFA